MSPNLNGGPVDESIGDAESGGAYIPVYGAGRNAINDFQNDRYIGGVINGFIALSDFLWVKSITQGGLRMGYAAAHKNGLRYYYGIGKSNTFTATKARWNTMGMRGPILGGTGYLHHSFIPNLQNTPTFFWKYDVEYEIVSI